MAPGLDDSQVEAVRRLVTTGALASRYGVRSLDRDHPERSPRNYWRGPAWTNVTWLSAWALAERGELEASESLREQMFSAVEGGGMREYFVPDSGRGLGARDFAWTAALTLRELAAGVRVPESAAAA
jgi:glycogen debranching enzyme